MTWTLSTSLDEFRAAAGEFLAAHPAQNTVLLTVMDRLDKDGPYALGPEPPRYGWSGDPLGGALDGVFLRTPPFPLRFGRATAEAAAELAAVLHARGAELDAVGGGRGAAEAFAAAWTRLAGVTSSVKVDERLYRLAELVPPSPSPAGLGRLAGPAERELLMAWSAEFMAEVGVSEPVDFAAWTDRRLADGSLYVWEDGGRVVSLAGASPLIAGMSRIGPVFTPTELRGHGYASAVVAIASAAALAQGATEVLLYTDLANPTSNSIYQKLGYRPVEDAVVLRLGGKG